MMENASRLLEHYLDADNEDYTLSDREVTEAICSHTGNVSHYCVNMKNLIEYIEDTVSPGSTAYISTNNDSDIRATCYYNGKSENDTIEDIYDHYLDSIMPQHPEKTLLRNYFAAINSNRKFVMCMRDSFI